MFHGIRTEVVLDQHWQWPYIVGSFVVAWLGSLTALHIMKQRTSDKGLANFIYLLAGSTAFGAIGVWSMHFIGMQALSLTDPTTGTSVEMRYDPLFTAMSLFVVVVIVTIGFYVAGDPLNQQWWRYVFGGLAGAGGVLTMHYLGMLAMTMQAMIEFDWRWVLGSVLIGVAVVSVGLLVFFRFRQLWQHNQFVLFACSLVLGVAVMGVHYSGLASATYYKTQDVPDISSYAPVSRLLYVNIALAATTCGVACIYLLIKWMRMLQQEQRKLKCLILNALILDTPATMTEQAPPPRVLCTTADTLPSVVIEQQYEGVGAFDSNNPDFLRMYKASTDWNGLDNYTKFLAQLKAKSHLSAYSVALHDKFVTAAKELCAQCGLQLSELDLLYWQPTQAIVTVVVRVSNAVGERVEKTTNCRFVGQETLYAAVGTMTDEADGKRWMDELINFHARSTLQLPVPPPVPTLSLPHGPLSIRSRISRNTPPRSPAAAVTSPNSAGGNNNNSTQQRTQMTLSARTKRFFANSVSPAPSPRPLDTTAAASASPSNKAKLESPTSGLKLSGEASGASANTYKLYLGLYYVKVEANGLQVMILRDGPFHHVPCTVMLESPVPFTALGSEHSTYLRDLRAKYLDFELGAQCMLPPPPQPNAQEKAGQEKKAREAPQEKGTAAMGGANSGLAIKPRFANHRAPSMVDESEDEVDDETRGDRHVKDTLRHLKKTTSTSTNSGPASPKSPTSEKAGKQQPPPPLGTDLPTFTTAFNHACYVLAELLGTSKDLQPANLPQLQLLPYGPRDWLLAFSVVRMSNRLDDYSQHNTVRWVSLKTFEILHYTRHTRHEGRGWTRRWVREQSNRGGGGSTGKRPGGGEYEDSVESGAMTKRGSDKRPGSVVRGDGEDSMNRRTTVPSEVLRSSDSAILKSHHRHQSSSHQRASSMSKSQRLALPNKVIQPSLSSSMPATARTAAILVGEDDHDAIAGVV